MYSPKIKPELVKQLYRLKHSNENKTPMTTMVNEAVELYLKTLKGGEEIENQLRPDKAGNQNICGNN